MIDLANLNPDAMAEDELSTLGCNLKLLGSYCLQKARAMQWRAKGRTLEALDAEKILDDIYQQLPAEWRW
jgi:hypothetical protein